jgi:7-carboxy-7-deazaguanine synthase
MNPFHPTFSVCVVSYPLYIPRILSVPSIATNPYTYKEPFVSQPLPEIQNEIPPAPKEHLPLWRDTGQQLQINEIFYSIEGEGLRVGQPTTFVRLSKCNLRCHFCDTEFDSYTEMAISEILEEVQRHSAKWVCLTGGEPLGQNLVPLCQALRDADYRIHIETNGTVDPLPELYDLIEHWTVSPKARTITSGLTRITELKYVVGKAFREDRVDESRAEYIYLQPETSKPEFIQKALEILTRHPDWRMSFRAHKIINLP